MGNLNFHNLADYAQDLLERLDPDELDLETLAALEDAAAGTLPPQVQARLIAEHHATTGQSRVREDAVDPDLSSPPLQPPTDHSAPLHEQVASGDGNTSPESNEHVSQSPLHHIPETSRDHMNTSRKCAAQNRRTGDPCKAWATPSGYCVFHDPELEDAVAEMRAKGGRTPRRILVGDARKLHFEAMDRGGIQALISHVIRLQLLGAMTPRQASTTVKLIGHLVSNAREMNAGDDTRVAFQKTTRTLVDFTDKLVEHLEGRDLADRVNAIQDAGSKREQILKANDRFAPRHISRSARTYPY